MALTNSEKAFLKQQADRGAYYGLTPALFANEMKPLGYKPATSKKYLKYAKMRKAGDNSHD